MQPAYFMPRSIKNRPILTASRNDETLGFTQTATLLSRIKRPAACNAVSVTPGVGAIPPIGGT